MQFSDFFRTQEIVFDMLADRGYNVQEKQKVSADEYDDFSEENIELYLKKNSGKQIIVIWSKNDVGVAFINTLYKKMKEEDIKNAMIIKFGKLTPNANTTITELAHELTIQVFDYSEICINPTKHILVPKHELLSKKETEQLLESYKIKKNQLPRIFHTDAIVKYYGWKRGNIVKISRKNGSIHYRCIV